MREGERDFAELLLLASTTRRATPVSLEAKDPGFIIHTSGTTSKPKGLVHAGIGFMFGTYANVKWAAVAFSSAHPVAEFTCDDQAKQNPEGEQPGDGGSRQATACGTVK